MEDANRSSEYYDQFAGRILALESKNDLEAYHSSVAQLVKEYGEIAKSGVLNARETKKERSIASWLEEHAELLWKTNLEKLAEEEFAGVAFAVAMKLVLIHGKYCSKSIKDEVAQLLHETLYTAALDEWAPYLTKYDDIRMWFLVGLSEEVEQNGLNSKITSRLVPILCSIDKTVSKDTDLRKFYAKPVTKATKYRAAFQKAWLSILNSKSGLTMNDVKEVLTVLHARIIPNMIKPQLLMDFLVDAYDFGGALSLLALDGLFALIQYHGLDYPHFYTKLYALLEDGSILVSSHRARFLRLLDLFLSSSHLPATITASMIKRLCRLCLFAPPGAIVAIIPLVYNQLKRHPTCMVMIHRSEPQDSPDLFDPHEKDPLLTHALESSLWELQTLTTHYQPNVATMTKVFGQPFRKQSYHLDHFLSHSYETLYNTESRRKREGVLPALEYEEQEVLAEISWSL